MKRIIIFYRTQDNKCPVQNFLDSLPGKIARRATWVLSLLQDLDIVPSIYFKKLAGTKEVWECRIRFGINSYRILCFFAGNSVIVLTHGFLKKTKKIPVSEIKCAETYREDFIRRQKHE
jgi:phage-related protein